MLRVYRHLRKIDLLYIGVSILFIALQVLLDLKMPDYMTEITRLVQTPGNEMSQIVVAGLKMLGCALGSLVAACATAVLTARISTDFSADLRSELYNRALSFSKAEIGSFSTASLITRTTNDVVQVQMLINMGMQAVIKAPMMALLAIVKMAGKSSEWSVSTAIAVVVALVIAFAGISIVLPGFKRIQKLTDELNRVTRENLNGLRVIRAYNAEEYQEEKFTAANNDLADTYLFTGRVMAFLMPCVSLILNGLSLSIYWIGAALINSAAAGDKLVIFSDMIVFSQYAMQVFMAFMMLVVLFVIFPRASVSARRILEVLDNPVSVVDGDIDNSESRGEVEFRNVCFRYPGGKEDVLENISFKATRGETVAFIGSTGSGKSTLIDLIPRFYDATEGEVLVDGINVKDYTLRELRRKISYVSQKAVLFSGTIRSNLLLGQEDNGGVQEIDRAVSAAQASEFIENLPEGVDAPVAQGGANFSGGQKQRLSIARALCRKPSIIIFDDSFSALDYKTDRALRRELNDKCSDVTRLVVAQRIGTIRDADRIIVLEEGRMVGCGTHSELMGSCDVYRQIALSQLSKEELE